MSDVMNISLAIFTSQNISYAYFMLGWPGEDKKKKNGFQHTATGLVSKHTSRSTTMAPKHNLLVYWC